jgi:hypothetical protein
VFFFVIHASNIHHFAEGMTQIGRDVSFNEHFTKLVIAISQTTSKIRRHRKEPPYEKNLNYWLRGLPEARNESG